jgi:hypothetical protein
MLLAPWAARQLEIKGRPSVEQKSKNQERTEKSGLSATPRDETEPSKAPRQDEEGRELKGSARHEPHQVDVQSDEQGISNRPVKEEHAFPATDESVEDLDESVETGPKQQGGNRGGV